MPSLTFVLPHWIYWIGLIAFPLTAMVVVRKKTPSTDGGISLPIAFLFWITAGFLGIHRFYLKNPWGLIYLPLFILVLFGNMETRVARQDLSNFRSVVLTSEFLMERAQADLKEGVEGAQQKLAEAKGTLAEAQIKSKVSIAAHQRWVDITGGIAGLILLLLLLDATLLPRLVRRTREREAKGEGGPEKVAKPAKIVEPGTHQDPTARVHTRITDFIDKISGFSGEFVCYWSLLAVFVYYYEVVARYVFNSPTNWAHESMFLMFGMQYLISGAFASREDSHVRVDVLYVYLSDRTKVIVDLCTSVFFFLFCGALLWTGIIFSMDSIEVWEVSFTEWAIQYWPVKISIAVGAVLLLLQGVSKFLKDIVLLTGQEA